MAEMNVPTFCIVTGASRGLGRETAIQMSQKFGQNSHLCLIGRSKSSLEETASLVRVKSCENVFVRCISADLADEDGMSMLKLSIFESIKDVSAFKHAVIIHNAGSIGQVTKYAGELSDVKYLQEFNMLNLTGPIAMTSAFFKAFGRGEVGRNIRRTVVHISSDSTTCPLKTYHIYSMVKAARDMFFRVMALEEPDVRILGYNPGPLDTALYREAMATSVDNGVTTALQEGTGQASFKKPERAAEVLVETIEEDKYESGSVVRCDDDAGIETK